jgi:hypothetical protein
MANKKLKDYSTKSQKRYAIVYIILGAIIFLFGLITVFFNSLIGILMIVFGLFLIIGGRLVIRNNKLISSQPSDMSMETTVFISPSGKKYHYNPDCAGENCKRVNLRYAKDNGYTECKKCLPYYLG